MESKAKFLGHPIHPMLIVFPLGLLATAVIFDLIALRGDRSYLFNAAYWMIAAGLIGGLLAAVFGLIDWLAIPVGTRAKNIGLWHGAGNVLVMVLFALSWFARRQAPDDPPSSAIALSLVGAGCALVTAWMGGELVDRLGVGVDTGANLNAPNSLTKKPPEQGEQQKPSLKRVA